ncbi:MAG: phage head-tail adapter protein [Lachnospiraceae bacterium]
MNKEWSEQNKRMQEQLRKEQTFSDGIKTLLELRQKIMNEILRMKQELSPEDFSKMPFPKANGYHSKTIAYSLWHIFRIEDIVAHSLIQRDEEVFFLENYQKRMKSPIITTGNELIDQEIEDFSKKLDSEYLYQYIEDVKESTENILKNFSFKDMKRKFNDEDKSRLCNLHVVGTQEQACWLIDYWCGKDIRGLIQMPFSRHWIMHIEACFRIETKIVQGKKKRES